ncbi:CRISPR-associated endoribonuclease Cas6 [Nodosilinea sp. LEGE 07088]|uniref:CRISPR-associated endoribonuclease Cas6 n=1 Tax=Nodosilinea sp. LEGE 07088 TaxID=2777968 RepID=UPI001881AB44|nr:CRISPR-associated endoribonuclease Cas6 [Nodosilinea sp. LEGE 07088]MBE9138851.1 CRISPR-associated endoribonuclease Cas6 [Nodosilinea sp. LEGE 07088]
MPRAAQETELDLSAKTLWPAPTELVSLRFDLVAEAAYELYPQYTIGLHAWFLQQIQEFDSALSAQLHDGETDKAFNISGLSGQFSTQSRSLQLQSGKTYQWYVNGLTKPVVKGLAQWLKHLPEVVALKNAPLIIRRVSFAQAPTTYAKLATVEPGRSLSLTFVSPTSFRRKGHHLPLPWPRNVFHSYLRRWNEFANRPVDQDSFLDWVDDYVVFQRHELASEKIAAGKRGSVTGFTGAVIYGLGRKAADNPDFLQLFYTLGHYGPYCGTGHKTTFGLGQTRLGWHLSLAEPQAVPAAQRLLADRIDELTTYFVNQKKRTGGHRAQDSAETWATVLARRELGDSLQAIAADLGIPYETAKTYSKLARRAVRGDA